MSYQYECPKCGKDHGREYSFVSLPTSRLCDSCEEDAAISTFPTQELVTELCKREGVENLWVPQNSEYKITLMDGVLDPASVRGCGEATILVVKK